MSQTHVTIPLTIREASILAVILEEWMHGERAHCQSDNDRATLAQSDDYKLAQNIAQQLNVQ